MIPALGPLQRVRTARGSLALRRAWPRSGGRFTLEYSSAAGVVAAQTPRSEPGGHAQGQPLDVLWDGEDAKLPALAGLLERRGATLVAHRAERRATVALDGCFLKVLRPGTVTALAERHRAAGGLVTPSIELADDDAGILALGTVPGRPLHDLLREGSATPEQLRAVGRALRQFHEHPLRLGGAGAEHGAAAEAGVIADWLAKLERHDPAWHDRVATVAAPVVQALLAGEPVAAVTLHRDLHDKQLLLTPEGTVGAIDLDTLTLGDPAVDLSNLLAHLGLRALQQGRAPASVEVLRAALLQGYGAPAAWQPRLELLEDAAYVRLSCVYAFRPALGHTGRGLEEALVAQVVTGRERRAVQRA